MSNFGLVGAPCLLVLITHILIVEYSDHAVDHVSHKLLCATSSFSSGRWLFLFGFLVNGEKYLTVAVRRHDFDSFLAGKLYERIKGFGLLLYKRCTLMRSYS